jgi:hypothetical protein
MEDTVKNIAAGNAREFERWLEEQDKSAWPTELMVKAQRALLTFKSLDQPNAENAPPSFMAASKADLAAFTEAYAAFSASKGAA